MYVGDMKISSDNTIVDECLEIEELDSSNYSEKFQQSQLNDPTDKIITSSLNDDENLEADLAEMRLLEGKAQQMLKKVSISKDDQKVSNMVLNSVILIQKVWRGSKTRKIINYYMELFNKENIQDFNQISPQKIFSPPHEKQEEEQIIYEDEQESWATSVAAQHAKRKRAGRSLNEHASQKIEQTPKVQDYNDSQYRLSQQEKYEQAFNQQEKEQKMNDLIQQMKLQLNQEDSLDEEEKLYLLDQFKKEQLKNLFGEETQTVVDRKKTPVMLDTEGNQMVFHSSSASDKQEEPNLNIEEDFIQFYDQHGNPVDLEQEGDILDDQGLLRMDYFDENGQLIPIDYFQKHLEKIEEFEQIQQADKKQEQKQEKKQLLIDVPGDNFELDDFKQESNKIDDQHLDDDNLCEIYDEDGQLINLEDYLDEMGNLVIDNQNFYDKFGNKIEFNQNKDQQYDDSIEKKQIPEGVNKIPMDNLQSYDLDEFVFKSNSNRNSQNILGQFNNSLSIPQQINQQNCSDNKDELDIEILEQLPQKKHFNLQFYNQQQENNDSQQNLSQKSPNNEPYYKIPDQNPVLPYENEQKIQTNTELEQNQNQQHDIMMMSERSEKFKDNLSDFTNTNTTQQLQKKFQQLKDDQMQKWEQMSKLLSSIVDEKDNQIKIGETVQSLQLLKFQMEINRKSLEGVKTPQIYSDQKQANDLNSSQQSEKKELNIVEQDIQNNNNLDFNEFNDRDLQAMYIPISLQSQLKEITSQFLDIDLPSKSQKSSHKKKFKDENDMDFQFIKPNTNEDILNRRAILPSEELIRKEQNSDRSIQSGLNYQEDLNHLIQNSIFEQNPFADFTKKKFKQIMMKKEDISNLIRMRQEVLEQRRKIQYNLIQNMYDKQKISPRTFKLKNLELEKWVDIEKENIKKTKKELKKTWLATADTIQRTQRDIEFMKKMNSDKKVHQPSFSEDDVMMSKIEIFISESESQSNTSSFNKIQYICYDSIQSPALKTSHGENSLNHGKQFKTQEDEDGDISIDKHPLSDDFQKSNNINIERNFLQDNYLNTDINLQFSNNFQQQNYYTPPGDKKIDSRDMGEPKIPCPPKDEIMIIQNETIPSQIQDIDMIFMDKEYLLYFIIYFFSSFIKIQEQQGNQSHFSYQNDLIDKLQKDKKEAKESLLNQLDTQKQETVPKNQDKKEHIFLEKKFEKIAQMRSKNEEIEILTDFIIENLLDDFNLEFKNDNQLITTLQETSIGALSEISSERERIKKVATSIKIPQKLKKKQSNIDQKNSNQKEKKKKIKGIKTNVSVVKEYLKLVTEYIKKHYLNEFTHHINIPLGPQPLEMLKYLHISDFSESQSILESSTDSLYQHQAILSTDIYSDLEKQIFNKKIINPQDNPRQIEFLSELEHIHNKGTPFPTKITPYRLREVKISTSESEKIMNKAQLKVTEWASCLVGLLFDKDDSQYQQNAQVDEYYINQIKEDRLSRMLATEVIENEERWIVYDDEQIEVSVEISDQVFNKLILETVEEFDKKFSFQK